MNMLLAVVVATAWFSSTLDGNNEIVAEGGEWNGTTEKAEDTDGGRVFNAVGSPLVFEADATNNNELVTVDARIYSTSVNTTFPNIQYIAVTLMKAGDDVRFAARTDDGWTFLSGTGIEATTNKWYDLRIRLQADESKRIAAFFIKNESGDYVQLKGDSGFTWFPATKCVPAEGLSSANFRGQGRFETLTGQDNDADKTVVAHGETLFNSLETTLNRPRAGKTAEVTVKTAPEGEVSYTYRWYKSANQIDKTFQSTPFAQGATTLAAEDRERWMRLVIADAYGESRTNDFYFSLLPVLYVTTDDGLTPTASKEEHDAHITMQGNDDYKSLLDNMKTVIKVRGNSTASYVKKPYKLKLDSKVNMFDFGKNKHWVLLANYNDMSQLRNKMAYDFANQIGGLGMDSTWVNFVLNGDFLGCYQFGEHIRADDKRVPIDEDTDYIFEFSEEYDEDPKFTIESGFLRMKTMLNSYPEGATNAEDIAVLTNFLQNYFDACTSTNKLSKEGKHYSEYCDVDSMVAFFFVNELFANNDARYKSRYAYLPKGGKLVWGPVWDFDWGMASLPSPSTTQSWRVSGTEALDTAKKRSMFKEWTSDPHFCSRLYRAYWGGVREKWVKMVNDPEGMLYAESERLKDVLAVNDQRWPRTRNAVQDVQILKDFFAARIEWMDQQFSSATNLVESLCFPTLQTNPVSLPYVFPGLMFLLQ